MDDISDLRIDEGLVYYTCGLQFLGDNGRYQRLYGYTKDFYYTCGLWFFDRGEAYDMAIERLIELKSFSNIAYM
jgi:hypothetical protein